jgi:hypothetical protein
VGSAARRSAGCSDHDCQGHGAILPWASVSPDASPHREVRGKEGFLYLKQFDLNALREFRDSWELGPRTALKKLERVKAFFRFATENEWVGVKPARWVRK